MMGPITLPDLTGWVALITRGSQGSGLRIAVSVSGRGANVAIAARAPLSPHAATDHLRSAALLSAKTTALRSARGGVRRFRRLRHDQQLDVAASR